jgi:hypothetical protein
LASAADGDLASVASVERDLREGLVPDVASE